MKLELIKRNCKKQRKYKGIILIPGSLKKYVCEFFGSASIKKQFGTMYHLYINGSLRLSWSGSAMCLALSTWKGKPGY